VIGEPTPQLPSSVMEYKGTWNASTNTPALADGTGDNGDVYLVSVAGSQDLGSGAISFAQNDWAIYNGSIWEKSLNTNAVVSVNTKVGTVVLDPDDLDDSATTNKFANDQGSSGYYDVGNTRTQFFTVDSTTDNAQPVSFPIAFSSVPYIIQVTLEADNRGEAVAVEEGTITTTGFSANRNNNIQNADDPILHILAIGPK